MILAVSVAAIWRQLPPRSRLSQTLAIGLVLLAAIMVYGISNYPLRRGLGAYTVFLLGLLVALADHGQALVNRGLLTRLPRPAPRPEVGNPVPDNQ
jgi:MFS-type transporter involved in bile tolerance (Atg22 family)